MTKRWRGRHRITAHYAGEAARFAEAQTGVEPQRPAWMGIEGVEKGSMSALCRATSPGQMELEIVLALAQRCEGVYVYTGRGMDGHFQSAAARAAEELADDGFEVTLKPGLVRTYAFGAVQ